MKPACCSSAGVLLHLSRHYMFRMSKASHRRPISTARWAITNTQRTTTYDEPTTTRTLYLSTCSVHIELLMMDAFDIRNM